VFSLLLQTDFHLTSVVEENVSSACFFISSSLNVIRFVASRFLILPEFSQCNSVLGCKKAAGAGRPLFVMKLFQPA
jgi:hypothetical protein